MNNPIDAATEVDEAELLDACRDGRVLDCAANGSRRRLDAALLRRCCLLKSEVDPRGIRLRNAVIAGTLDLAGFDVSFPLRFENCVFETALLAEGASLTELALTGCPELPGLLGNGLRVSRDLDLSRTRVTGGHRTSASTSKRSAIWLCGSDITGRLICLDTTIESDGERSLQADRMHVGGTVRLLQKFSATGEIRLIGANIEGSLDLSGAHIVSATGLALDLDDAVIDGSVFLIPGAGRHTRLKGRIDLGSARIAGQVLIRDVVLEGGSSLPTDYAYAQARLGGTAIWAPRLSVGGEVTFEGSCEITGGLDLSMSEMSAFSIGGKSSISAPGRTALDLTSAQLRSSVVVERGAVIAGTVRLMNATVGGFLSFRGAILKDPEEHARPRSDHLLMGARGATVNGDVDLRDLTASGGRVDFRRARLGGAVVADEARLANPEGYTLSLHQTVVNGSVRLNNISSTGMLVLNRASVDGILRCTGGSFTCPAPSDRNQRGHGIEAISAAFRGGMDLGWRMVWPSADFTNASTSFLADDPGNWPPQFIIAGLTYDRYERPQGGERGQTWDPAVRSAWLGRQVDYDGGPYEQAASVFREHGYSRGAEEILIAQRKAANSVGRSRSLPRRAWQTVYGAATGYGYRPLRVFWLLAVLLALVIVSLEVPAGEATMRASDAAGDVYSTTGLVRGTASPARAAGHSGSCGDGQVRCFSPVLYAIDTVVPLVSLEQRSTWYPDPEVPAGTVMQWWLNIATLLGWLLSSIFALSLARLVRSS